MLTFKQISEKRLLAARVIEQAHLYDWSVQGFGLIRTYLPGNKRLHIWSQRFKIQDATTLHSHPWNFTSHVLAGRMHEIVAEKVTIEQASCLDSNVLKAKENKILCGEDAKVITSTDCFLSTKVTYHQAGLSYSHKYSDIHASLPSFDCVTLIEREPLDDPDHAYSYTLNDDPWVSAEPRGIDHNEIEGSLNRAHASLVALL